MQKINFNLAPFMKIKSFQLISREYLLKKDMKTSTLWKCRCSCGHETFIFENNLIYNKYLECKKCYHTSVYNGEKIIRKSHKKKTITSIKHRFTPEQVARASSMHSHQSDPLI